MDIFKMQYFSSVSLMYMYYYVLYVYVLYIFHSLPTSLKLGKARIQF